MMMKPMLRVAMLKLIQNVEPVRSLLEIMTTVSPAKYANLGFTVVAREFLMFCIKL